jgi:hypothetical protein
MGATGGGSSNGGRATVAVPGLPGTGAISASEEAGRQRPPVLTGARVGGPERLE